MKETSMKFHNNEFVCWENTEQRDKLIAEAEKYCKVHYNSKGVLIVGYASDEGCVKVVS